MNLHFLSSSQKKKLLSELKEQFGINSLPYLLIESGKEKLRGFSGHLSKEELSNLNRIINIELIGLYLIKKETPIRLSFDAPHLLKSQISSNILKINKEETQAWLKGANLEIKLPRGTYIIEHENNFIGCGKSNSSVLLNHVPKDRRLRK